MIPLSIPHTMPEGDASRLPVIDELTRKMTAAWRVARPTELHRGFSRCSCLVISMAPDRRLADGTLIGELCVHNLAHHRGEVGERELAQVAALPHGEAEPTENELMTSTIKLVAW